MFETAFVGAGHPARRAWSVSTSLALQGLVLGGVLLAGILAPVAMPEAPELTIRVPAPQLPKAVRVVPVTAAAAAAAQVFATTRRIFTPVHVPPRAATIVDLTDGLPIVGARTAGTSSDLGIPNSLGDPLPALAKPPEPPKAAAPAEAPRRVVIGGSVLAARIIDRPQPRYPPLAVQMRVEGVVLLHGVISKEGRVVKLEVRSGHPLLVRAALEAVERWRYQPTYLNQQPVEVEAPIEVRFVLSPR